MPRRRVPTKRVVLPDPKFNSVLITKFINHILKDGKKSLSEKICYGALDIIKEKTKEDQLKMFKQAIDNVKPVLEVKSRRVGGSTYQVPIEVMPDRRVTLSMRWIMGFAQQRKEKTIQERLAAELLDAANGVGSAMKKKEDTHKMTEANKAFAHYRW